MRTVGRGTRSRSGHVLKLFVAVTLNQYISVVQRVEVADEVGICTLINPHAVNRIAAG